MAPGGRCLLASALVCGLLAVPSVAAGATTTTVVASSVNPSVFGQPVTFTATVSPSDAVVPTGTVTFSEGATTLGAVTVAPGGGGSNARAQLQIATLPASGVGHTIKAQYNGDGTHSASSGTVSQTVVKANTTLTLSSDHAPSVFGQAVSLTATIGVAAPGGGTPTGNVTFTIDGTGQPPVATSDGKATFIASSLTVPGSPHTVSAAFNDTAGNHNGSAGSLSGGQTVNRADMAIAVESSLNPSAPGETVALTAIASGAPPGGGTPTGTINFFDGSTPIGTAPLSGGRAYISTSELSTGNHSIVATTVGDANFNPGVGGPLTQSVVEPVGPVDPVVPVVPDTTPPAITDFELTHARFTAARRATGKPPKGTKVHYTLSEAATVTFTVEKSARRRRAAIGGSFTAAGVLGPNSFKFRGRVGGKRLVPGRYSLTATAADIAGNVSSPRSVRFRIARSTRH